MSPQQFHIATQPYRDKLFRFAFHLLGKREDAEETLQDVMLRLWEKRQQWNQIDNHDAYFMRMIRNAAIDRMRKRKLQTEPVETQYHIQDRELDPHQQLSAQEGYQRIINLMHDLPAAHRDVIYLREVEGYSYDEIAHHLDLTLDQVKTNLFRARRKMRELLLKNDAL